MSATAPSAEAAPRLDNLFGVCAALGADLGFDPFYLRIALAVGVIAAPEMVLIAYASAGVLVVLSRLLTRDRRRPRHTAEVHSLPAAPPAVAEPVAYRRAA